MGIDEAGRGPVLGELPPSFLPFPPPSLVPLPFLTHPPPLPGPMVYGAAFCPLSFLPTLQTLGFDDSKALNHATRNHLFSLFLNPASSTRTDDEGHHELHYSTRVISPADISRDMMRGVAPINLNKQAEDATIALIGEVKRRGIDLAEVSFGRVSSRSYTFSCFIAKENLDADMHASSLVVLRRCSRSLWTLGSEALSSLPVRLVSSLPFLPFLSRDASSHPFPTPSYLLLVLLPSRTIAFTVCPKADSLFKIVGAASIAAKVNFQASSSLLPRELIASLSSPSRPQAHPFPRPFFLKITRDRWIENWIHPEPIPIVHLPFVEEKTAAKRKLGPSGSSGSLKGKKKAKMTTKAKKLLKVGEEEDEGSADEGEAEEDEDEEVEEEEIERLGKNGLGSGYPSGESWLLGSSFRWGGGERCGRKVFGAFRDETEEKEGSTGRVEDDQADFRSTGFSLHSRSNDQILPQSLPPPSLRLPIPRSIQLEYGQGHPR